MPTLHFVPVDQSISVEPNTKILVGAKRQKVEIRFGCAACRCGTCAVAVAMEPPSDSGEVGALTPMKPEEHALLKRMGLAVDGSIRLACQARILSGTVAVDLAFQKTYSPDETEDAADDGE